jgi:4-aminobutyrate aminotransferase-like enzyme
MAELIEEKMESLRVAGRTPSVFICEPLIGNAGGVELPPGYLKRVYSIVHAHGGLCICDEVQVGYGRMGSTFWCFESQDVVPDIITMAKAAGNGHPLGYVLTSKSIAKAFHESEGSFFSSAGGSPVSCAIGSQVIQLIKQENLQKNAYEIGKYLNEKLKILANKYPDVIGCIHGYGLYQGVEIVNDGNHSPAPSAMTKAICNRLLSLGTICHGTGDYSNILKVKPPLCFTKRDADHFIDSLEMVLTTGW